MLHINVASVVFGDATSLDSLPAINFTHPFDSISIRDLIARSVELQISDLIDNRERSKADAQALLDKQFFSEIDLVEQAATGKIALARPELPADQPIDVSVEIARATRAFESGRFKIFANGTDYTDLNDEASFQDAVQVKFMRIMPLKGG